MVAQKLTNMKGLRKWLDAESFFTQILRNLMSFPVSDMIYDFLLSSLHMLLRSKLAEDIMNFVNRKYELHYLIVL